MAAVRNPGTRTASEDADSRHETLTVETLGAGEGDEVASLVEMHRRVAARHLQAGAPSKAFGELVRASRALPMTPRLAAHLVAFSLQAGTEPAAITLLQTGIDDQEGALRTGIRLQLARLFRKVKEHDRAREQVVLVLAEESDNRRARSVLNALLEHGERWDELDASLEKEAKEALRRRQLRRAARATLHRARVYERLENAPRASLRYAQAASYLEQAKDAAGAFDLRMLWLRSLRSAGAPARALEEAVRVFLQAGAAAGQAERARALLEALGLSPAKSGTDTQPRAVARTKTQRELVIAAALAEAQGRAPEATALLAAAVNEAPDLVTQRRLEAHFVARRAWRELAQFYRDRIATSDTESDRVEWLTRLAEVLEDELQDPDGAARAYEEIVQLTGDEGALREQVRLLAARQDQSGVRRALDSAVNGAASGPARIRALVARGEAALRKRDFKKALGDFAAALEVDPRHLAARAGRAEAAFRLGKAEALEEFQQALQSAPRRFARRVELLRRLGALASGAGAALEIARWAWTELLSELPGDPEAEDRLAEVARKLGDDDALEHALALFIEREPRGPKTRLARIERVELLERLGRRAEALKALREAVRFEPGHKEAWLLLSDRCAERGINGESAWALEQAATSTEDSIERAQTWLRLARFTREVLRDAQKAEVFERRGRKLLDEDDAVQVSGVMIPAPPMAAPDEDRAKTQSGDTDPRGPERAATVLEVPQVQPDDEPSLAAWREEEEEEDEVQEVSGPALTPLPVSKRRGTLPSVAYDVLEITTGDILPVVPAAPPPPEPTDEIESWDAPPGAMDEGPGTVELPVPLGEAGVAATPSSPTPALMKLREDRTRLLARVREEPLEPEGYRALGEYFDHVGDADRSSLMHEIAGALEGDPNAIPRTPRLILSATDRAGLRHPALRHEEGELLALCGSALCRAHVGRIRGSGGKDEFRMDAGRGSQSAAEALLAAVRILGLRAPDVFLSEENGPPFSLTWSVHGPRVLVGRLAVKKALPDAELRFFAGRALFTQNPDLLALRILKKEQVARGLAVVSSVVRSRQQMSGEARAIHEALPTKAIPRIRELLAGAGRKLQLSVLSEAARHSANRAGLVVAGGVAPALAALQAKKALESELVELIRFAASERYLQIRARRT